MQRIRLTRIGKKKKPFYRIVVAPQDAPVKGKFTAILGNFDPFTKKLSLNEDGILSWLNVGARPSNTVAKLLLGAGMKHKLIVYKKARKISKKELDTQKAQEEAEKAKEAAEKEAAKAEWEQKAQELAEEHESSDEKLVETTDEKPDESADSQPENSVVEEEVPSKE